MRSVRQEIPREILVVDGGSSDGTCEAAREADRVLQGPRGRAVQMNLGAGHAVGDVLLFLHADCTLEPGALAAAEKSLDGAQRRGGMFPYDGDAADPVYRLIDACATGRVRLTGLVYGDQGLFVQRGDFRPSGGFPPLRSWRSVPLQGAAASRADRGRTKAHLRVAAPLEAAGRSSADAAQLGADRPGGRRRPPGSAGGVLSGGTMKSIQCSVLASNAAGRTLRIDVPLRTRG